MIRESSLLFALCLCVGPAWAINKCTGHDGKVMFQDAPCSTAKSEKITIQTAPPTDPHSMAIQRAIWNKEPAVGMNHKQLEQAMGLPQKINPSQYGHVFKEQLIYEKPNATWYVYTENGFVTSIQRRDISPSQRHRPKANSAANNCPPAHEIRNMERSASSITLSERERVERLRAIREIRERCHS